MEETNYNWLLGAVAGISSQTALLISCNTEDEEPLDAASLPYCPRTYSSQEAHMQPTPARRQTPEHVLKSVFGYDSFRPMQREVIQNVLDGRDTLAVMPTGGGKSLCYEIPALILDGLTVVISPLIALMQDQVAQLEAVGVPAVFLNSSLDWDAYQATCEHIRRGDIKLLYVSPEGLNTGRIQDLLHSENVTVACLTIDEAHCISEWGHDFRPDYMEIAAVRGQFPHAVCLALTATATRQVRADIVNNLHLETPAVLVASFNRGNIFLAVKKKSEPLSQILAFLRDHADESGIIYCFSRKQVDELTADLTRHGLKALNYHAGLSDAERSEHQRDFIQDKADIMVATVAFGMGINKPDVRFVIHYDMPKSIEQYYQEIGRAGRDGLPASALLLYGLGDLRKIRYFFTDKEDPAKAEKLLQGMVRYADSRLCRRSFLLSYFGERYSPTAEDAVAAGCCCDICARGPLDAQDVTIPAQKYMSCILRTRQRYGAAYVIDVLIGNAKNKRIQENGDDALSTYGIGTDLSRQDWFELNACLQDAGYLAKTEEHSVVYLTDYGRQALRERQQIMLPIRFVGAGAQAKAGALALPKPGKKAAPLLDDGDEEGIRIAEALRTWRRRMADEMNVPPYVIFGDKTLFSIASRKPKGYAALLDCYGMGDAKVRKFGEDIFRIVKNE